MMDDWHERMDLKQMISHALIYLSDPEILRPLGLQESIGDTLPSSMSTCSSRRDMLAL